jgi:iron complex transport system permease protein
MAESLLTQKPIARADAALWVGWRPRPSAGALLLAGLLAILALLLVASLALGSVAIPLDQILRVLAGGEAERGVWADIVLKIRLPKALTAVLAGAALGVAGLVMQTYFRNPLAGPFVLGVSSGASLGVALVVLTTGTVGGVLLAGAGLAGDLALVIAAAAGAALAMAAVLAVAGRVGSPTTLLLVGLMLSYMTSALVSLLLFFAVPERIQAYVNWTFGSFGGVTWSQMPLLAGTVLAGLALALALGKSLNALLLGEAYAASLGLDVRRARLAVLGTTALLASAVTAFCGPIGFIGLAVPHLARGLARTSDHRLLLPTVALCGAIVALGAAIIAEVPGHNLVLPLNAVTAFLGAPVVIAVLLRTRRYTTPA